MREAQGAACYFIKENEERKINQSNFFGQPATSTEVLNYGFNEYELQPDDSLKPAKPEKESIRIVTKQDNKSIVATYNQDEQLVKIHEHFDNPTEAETFLADPNKRATLVKIKDLRKYIKGFQPETN